MSLENSAQERALWIKSYIRQVLASCPDTSRRAAKRAAQEALASLLDARKKQERLFNRLERREKELDKPTAGKPVSCTCRPRTKAASASALVLYRQAQEQQGKGRAILAKRIESTAPSVIIRKHSSN